MATDNLVKTEKKELLDIILLVFLMAFTILIVFPFYNVVVVSFTSTKEYFEKQLCYSRPNRHWMLIECCSETDAFL